VFGHSQKNLQLANGKVHILTSFDVVSPQSASTKSILTIIIACFTCDKNASTIVALIEVLRVYQLYLAANLVKQQAE
jgi:hypothetical protein